MIRAAVTFLNKFHRYTTYTPLEIIENRYPAYLSRRLQEVTEQERAQKIKQQKLKVRKAQLDPLGVQLLELQQSYNQVGSTMSRNDFLGRREQIYQRMREAEIKRKNL